MAILLNRPTLSRLPWLPLQPEDFTTLLQTREFRLRLLEAIASATRRVYLCALYLENEEAGREILDALYQAKQRQPQLDVRVMVDWHRAQRGRIGEDQANCNARWYREEAERRELDIPVYGVPVQTRELFGVLHLKGFIVDDTVFYSGASLNNVYLHKLDKYRFDRYHLVRSPALADAMAGFMAEQFFNDPAVFRLDKPTPPTRSIRKEIRQFRDKLAHSQYRPHGAQTLPDEQLAVSPVVGIGKGNRLNRVILDVIASAQQQLFICTPYFNFPRAVVLEINRALRRGVEIDIVVGDKTANDFYIPPEQPFRVIGALPYLYEMNLRRFAKRQRQYLTRGQLRIRLWKDGDNSFHLKGVWSDARYILLTGNNLNPRAFRLDLENALLLHDPHSQLREQSLAEQQSIMRHTTLLAHYRELEDVRHYPERIKKLLTRLSRVRIDRMLNLML
ncbi:CDP-diacylglycerol--serine O-phosphatidyltransferase [Chromobacterium sp. ATCC 53434]|uniref:CDP-diacylglycerol--serine O-phosphatidyltransferase n=1 Tax=Chromobacterium sp. (strain ATCC 53434 / SC 14030) TaxID=2059672 RepID=UPI000C77642C|nr:CDP-diacylglycerol--serine O-phosphatidyltransferase [Chromobacterium sp. ATCC 53434]AUH52318.1 CDP-diacylglycerol--serine O-phosphatidyltransferase [Chromobacterium sp. ATCC 53434]